MHRFTKREKLRMNAYYRHGMSTYNLAKTIRLPVSSIRRYLYDKGLIRRAPGRDIEDQVVAWAKKKGHRVFQLAGDEPYDALVDGVRVQIKSANPSTEDKPHKKSYRFEINHDLARNNNKPSDRFDELWLVLLPSRQIVSLPARDIDRLKSILSLPQSLKTKYNYTMIGKLPA